MRTFDDIMRPILRGSWRARLLRSAVVWLVVALLAWLDRHGLAGVQRAEIFGWLVDAFVWIYRAYTAVEGFIEAHLIAVVTWLWDAVRWLSQHVADFLTSTGGMFARVWDSAKLFWENVLRPALAWLYDFYTKVKDWLKKVFQPVFDFLNDVRTYLKEIYKRFVEPILTILDVTRAGLRLLGDVGVQWAKKLDTTLGEIESTINETWAKINSKVNEVIDLVGALVTPGGLLQRLPFLRTFQRDVFYLRRVFANSLARPLTDRERKKLRERTSTLSVPELNANLAAYWNGESNDVGAAVDALAATAEAIWKSDDFSAAA